MNTNEQQLGTRSDTAGTRLSPIGAQFCSAVRFLCALLTGCGILALTLSSGPASARVITSQTETFIARLKDPQFITDGAKLFAPNCGSGYCHGAGGIGGGAPRLRDKELDPQYIFKTVSNGVSGTAMLSFKSDFSEEQIWKVVAFILSDAKVSDLPQPSQPKTSTASVSDATVSTRASAATPAGDAKAGKGLFFNSSQLKSCHACHAFDGEGGSIGPDLSSAGTRSARELFSDILVARHGKDSRYVVLTLALKNGDKIIGIKKDEDAESVHLYDIGELPAVLRTVQKGDITKSENAVDWAVHKDNASLYTIKQLLDLVTFLKFSSSKSPVTLADIL